MDPDYSEFNGGDRIPEYIGWIVTKRCNLKCPHCYVARIEERELSEEEKLQLLREAIGVGLKKIDLTGGEFLLDESAPKIIKLLFDSGVETTVFTNGLSLTEERIDFLSSFPIELIISLDGGKRETHELVRGKGSWERLLSSVSILSLRGVKFSFLMAINKFNFKETYSYVKLARECGAEKACFIPTMLSGRADPRIVPEPIEILKFLEDVENVASELKYPVSLWCMPFADILVSSPHIEVEHCRIGEPDIVDIDPMGNLLLCDVLSMKFGNVLRRGFVAALNEQSKTPIFNSIFDPNPVGPCKECQNWNRCKSGCFARSCLMGDILSPDPLCPKVSGLFNKFFS